MQLSDCFTHVSSKAGCDPVRLIFLCVPSGDCSTREDAMRFASRSGWLGAVEEAGSALVAPSCPGSWEEAPRDLLHSLYAEARGSLKVACGRGIPGKNDVSWLWETLICVVGYGDGATFALDYAAAHPGFSAATVAADGVLGDAEPLDRPSEHWFVPQPSEAYEAPANKDVPVAVWLAGAAGRDDRTREAFCHRGAPEGLVRVDASESWREPGFAERALSGFLSSAVRWKSSPDGTLVCHHAREEFYAGGEYAHREVRAGGISYPYALYIPRGMSAEEARGLPLVASVHGRGEPAWLFSDKNGWERLADETRGFMVALPDSPGNVWQQERDQDAMEALVADAVDAFGADPERIYLTGFSNGAVYVCQQATTRPRLFAAASPWNGPGVEAVRAGGLGEFVFADGFKEGGVELPFWICYGAADGVLCRDHEDDLRHVLGPNGCSGAAPVVLDGENRYLAGRGYVQGKRMRSRMFLDAAGVAKVGITEVQDLPHGAIPDEARAAWEFMKRFRRVGGGARVEVTQA